MNIRREPVAAAVAGVLRGFLTVVLGATGHAAAGRGLPGLEVLAMTLPVSVLGAAPLLARAQPGGRALWG